MIRKLTGKFHKAKNSGYTLVELLVAMTLTAIFATAVVALLPSATRIYMQIQDMSRAQVVADMVVDALREECSDTYIEDFASARIVNATATDAGDATLLATLQNINTPSASSGNVLVIRKSDGYCEMIYSCIAISGSNYDYIYNADQARVFVENGVSSRAVYRFFPTGQAHPLPEASQGYVHYGYYQAGKSAKTIGADTVSCIFPAIRYDYTNPFTNDAYNGYTVELLFSDMDYAGAEYDPDSDAYLLLQRPASVNVTVNVYKCDFAGQASADPIYSRTALLAFAEDTTK